MWRLNQFECVLDMIVDVGHPSATLPLGTAWRENSHRSEAPEGLSRGTWRASSCCSICEDQSISATITPKLNRKSGRVDVPIANGSGIPLLATPTLLKVPRHSTEIIADAYSALAEWFMKEHMRHGLKVWVSIAPESLPPFGHLQRSCVELRGRVAE